MKFFSWLYRFYNKLNRWSDNNPFIGYWVPVLLVAGFIFYLSSQSSPPTPPKKIIEVVPYWRKITHMLLYTVLAVLFYRASSRSTIPNLRENAPLLTLLFTVWYGTFDELHQSLVPYRVGHYIDIIVDGLGGLLGILLVYVIKIFASQKFYKNYSPT